MSDLYKLGLSLHLDFITTEEEQALLAHLNTTDHKKCGGRNSISRFGSKLPYSGDLKSAQLPSYFDFLTKRVLEKGLLEFEPDSITVNEYKKGQHIAPHIDSQASGEVISVLSLKSSAVMVLKLNREQRQKVVLPPRSFVQMRDDVRHRWTHAIEPVPDDRFSVVLRCSKEAKKFERPLSLESETTSNPQNHCETTGQDQPSSNLEGLLCPAPESPDNP